MHANFLFVEGENTLAVYTKDGKRIFFEQILSFFVEGTTLNATLPLSDRLNRVAECVWELEENGCTQTKFTIRQTGALPRQSSSISPCESTSPRPQKNSSMPSQNTEEDPPLIALPEDLFAYAFFESILFRADYTQFLSDELKSDADKIPTFLGEFIGVSLTNTPNICGLIKKKNERLFEVIPFSIVVENGKIVDVKSDFFNKIEIGLQLLDMPKRNQKLIVKNLKEIVARQEKQKRFSSMIITDSRQLNPVLLFSNGGHIYSTPQKAREYSIAYVLASQCDSAQYLIVNGNVKDGFKVYTGKVTAASAVMYQEGYFDELIFRMCMLPKSR
jgi:hypothetical protein